MEKIISEYNIIIIRLRQTHQYLWLLSDFASASSGVYLSYFLSKQT